MTVGLRSARFDQRVGGRHPTGKVLRHRTYGRLGSGRELSSPPDAPQPCPSPLSAPPASSPADWSPRSAHPRRPSTPSGPPPTSSSSPGRRRRRWASVRRCSPPGTVAVSYTHLTLPTIYSV